MLTSAFKGHISDKEKNEQKSCCCLNIDTWKISCGYSSPPPPPPPPPRTRMLSAVRLLSIVLAHFYH